MTGWTMLLAVALAAAPGSGETVFKVDAQRVVHRLSPYLYGACIEDVNHEIYGGLYSQMIFGESFQEPPRPRPLKGFTTYGGHWQIRDDELLADAGDGPKLVSDAPAFASGEVGVEVLFPSEQGGNAGLVVNVDRPGIGADKVTAYEVSLETTGHLVLGRHRQNWEPLQRIACPVPVDRWIPLRVRLKPGELEVLVDGKSMTTFRDTEHPLAKGRVGLRTWQRPARFRNLRIESDGSSESLPFAYRDTDAFADGVSGMWGPVKRGEVRGSYALESKEAFIGRQSQRITFTEGKGAIGIENQGLNRWGLNLVANKPYFGLIRARADRPAELTFSLESRTGDRIYAEATENVTLETWTTYALELKPNETDRAGRFAITLKNPGSVAVGYVSLIPGPWGRFQYLKDRKDVADALIAQGLTVLRYGGSMVNHPEYRWKNMIGPTDLRPPTGGMWYPYSSNGWGIFDFLAFCEAAGFLGIPAINMGETPSDMADFIAYANAPADTPWGRKRAADGHPEPYRLKYLELGNEEAVNDAYWQKFQPMAEAIWAKDPEIILIVGDFAYHKVIENPFQFDGGVAVKTLAGHQKILELAKARGREVWFDIHIDTDHPPLPGNFQVERSYIDQLGKIAPGAKYKVVIFEFNSGNHAQRRALSNALAINEVERVGALLPIACSANCLQPDGQNDNGWDQGLLFLNPSQVWLQPPGYVTRMARNASQPLLVESSIDGPSDRLSLNAKRSEDGKSLVLQVVNWDDRPRKVGLHLQGFTPTRSSASVEQLSGPLDAVNTAESPNRIQPKQSQWRHGIEGGRASYTLVPNSFTVIRFE